MCLLSKTTFFVASAFFCFVLCLILVSFWTTGVPGIRIWCIANGLAATSFLVFALSLELQSSASALFANSAYALSGLAWLAGTRRFFERKARLLLFAGSIIALAALEYTFHFVLRNYAWRTAATSLFQSAIFSALSFSVIRSKDTWRTPYPYIFTIATSFILIVWHLAQVLLLERTAETGAFIPMAHPPGLFILAVGSMIVPVLTMGTLFMVHDKLLANSERSANKDFLTNTWTRRAFFEFAEKEVSRARRTDRKPALLLFDADFFKLINDTHGHAVGDGVLVDIAERVHRELRKTDLFARIGGEEFAVLLPESNASTAKIVAERLRAVLDHNPSQTGSSAESAQVRYSVSVGGAVLEEGESFTELMHRADRALYKAKSSGRNCVIFYDEGDLPPPAPRFVPEPEVTA